MGLSSPLSYLLSEPFLSAIFTPNFSLTLPILSAYLFLFIFYYFFPSCLSTTCVWESVHNQNGGGKTAVRGVKGKALKTGNIASMGIQLTHGTKPQAVVHFF
jgi:hypothetical protein